MTNTHDYTWDDEFEPIGTVPVVGDVLRATKDSLYPHEYTVSAIRDGACFYGTETWKATDVEDVTNGTFRRILKRKKTPEKPSENKENPQKKDEKVQILDENDLFSLAADRIEIRSDGYGPEQSFGHIARRWNVMMENRGSDFRFSACDVALFMLDFKLGRRESRASSGKAKRDDFTDACGYLWWADKLVEEE